MRKFFGVIGNPPYQEETKGTSRTALPIYNHFMEESFKVSERVELITPARFLFNAGRTPKEWNAKRLADPHFSVLRYENDGSRVFPDTDIKGGVAVTYRDETTSHDPIGVFVPFDELRSILKKVQGWIDEQGSMQSVTYVATKFDLDEVVKDYPNLTGRERRMSSNVLDFDLFSDVRHADDDISVLGLVKSKRTRRFIERRYVDTDGNLFGYKALLPKAIGSGAFGESLGTIELGVPGEGYTHTFMGLGDLPDKRSGDALIKYLKSKFARAMLGILKVTQDNTLDKWSKVPLQDFTSGSDIDWSKPIADIDRQLYAKYGLTGDEVAFIESHVKEMS